ncbi:hypothetical protein CR207_16820 [Chromobacterium violaceum]|uniref:hypothetical protein n=1 Tax=Chromobacterium violaceum TaxID=536 RepID=UPI0009DA7238|nr:hypothetical protein [Chromobacterium violaceum]ATP29903.1 hypothetical protein CRN81_16800 [Chromobacterium violaceum]ATP33809.1 hypothetical protein CR207_16820 [Chromobacterium violaceum]OQS29653.1 hypothetical protein B0T41_03755 [Chromobacterium violaceum]
MTDRYAAIDADFLARFPGGFQDPDWQTLARRHKSYAKAEALCQRELTRGKLDAALESGKLTDATQACRQIISLATTVSTFEKIAFRNYMDNRDLNLPFVQALRDALHDFGPASFETYVDTLAMARMDPKANAAKWPIVSCFLACFDPQRHVCIKPTTVKKVAARLGVDIHYRSRPNYECYLAVQRMVLDFRSRSAVAANVDNTLAQAVMYCAV